MARRLRPCGTDAAYKRHLYHGEVPCGLCAEAHRQVIHASRNQPPFLSWRYAHASAGQARINDLLGELIHALALAYVTPPDKETP